MCCWAVMLNSTTLVALWSCNLLHPQLLPCVITAISLNKHRQEGQDVLCLWKGSLPSLKPTSLGF